MGRGHKEPEDPCAASERLVAKYRFRVPHSEEWADYVWPGLMIKPDKVIALQDVEFGEDDIVIATYPKAGTTWASEVVSAIAYEGNVDVIKEIRMDFRVPWMEINDKSWLLNTLFVLKHNVKLLLPKADHKVKPKKNVYFTHLPLELLPRSILAGKCKLLYVARNPKDQCVSLYHFHKMARFLGQQTDTTWDEFFRIFASENIMLGGWFEHVLGYWRFVRNNPRAKFIKFEEMKADLLAEMPDLEEFVGVKLPPEVREKVVRHCSFDSMKDNKMTNREGVLLFNQSNTKFMRKGIVGDWKNYFTLAQSEAFDQLYKQRMDGSGLDFVFE